MSIYQRYLSNETPIPLDLTAPEDIVNMSVDGNGNFICNGSGMRQLPVWTTDPNQLCQQSQAMQQQLQQQQQDANPFSGSTQQQQQPQQQQQQQPPAKQEKSDGVAGWIKDMFGGN
jgi:penicillin-binding protein 1B